MTRRRMRPVVCVRDGCGYVEDHADGNNWGLEHCERPMRELTRREVRVLRRESDNRKGDDQVL